MRLSIGVMLVASMAASIAHAEQDLMFSSSMEKIWCSDNPAAFVSPLDGGVARWSTYFGEEFPGPKSAYVRSLIPKHGYAAVKFYTGSVVDTGGFQTIETTNNSGVRLGSISECPGDFDVQDQRCTQTWGLGGTLLWSTEGHPRACPLKPHTTYYISVTFTDGFNPDSDTCSSDKKCLTEFRVAN